MDPRLIEALDRWVEAGLIPPSERQAIAAFENARTPQVQAAAAGRAGGRAASIAEAVAYAGAVVGLAGVGSLFVSQYRQLGSIGRPTVLGAVAAVALGAASLLGLRRGGGAILRARAAALTLAAVGLSAMVFQVQVEIRGIDLEHPPAGDAVTVAGLVAASVGLVVTTAFLAWIKVPLLAVTAVVAAYIMGGTILGLRHGGEPLRGELVWTPIGAVLVLMAEWNRGRARGAAEVLAFAGVLGPVIAAFVLAGAGHLWLEVLGGVACGLALGVSVARSSPGYTLAGGIGLFAFVLDVEFRYFANSLGFALTLITAGLALLAIASLLVLLWSRLAKTQAGIRPSKTRPAS